MAAKAANVIDRKASNIKEQAEEIMDMHGYLCRSLVLAHQLHGMNWTMPLFTL